MKKYFELAQNIANIFSHDEKFKVGAVILNRKNFDILSIGYNRFSDIAHKESYSEEIPFHRMKEKKKK